MTPLGEVRPDEIVLILALTGCDARLARAALTEAGMGAKECRSVDELCYDIAAGAGAAVVAREALTPPALSLLSGTLSRQPAWSDLPLIVLTTGRPGGSGDLALDLPLRALYVLGNATFLERPLHTATLVRSVRVALNSRRRQYEIREHLRERERAEAERMAMLERQHTFLRDVLLGVTEGKLRLCAGPSDLPPRRETPPDSDEGPVELTPRSLRALRERTQKAAHLTDFDLERESDIVTAVHEAAMNAVAHAGGGSAEVTIDPSAGTVQVRVQDAGSGIDIDRLPRATLERGFSSAGTLGHGFWLMLKAADRLWLLTGPEGTTIVIEKDRLPSEPDWLRWEQRWAATSPPP